MYFSQLDRITDGRILRLSRDMPIRNLLTDSRKVIREEGSVFFALRGERYDGHQFIEELYATGIRQFVVGEDIDPARLPETNIIRVAEPLYALQELARLHREQYTIPVIGITGSNGKTIIKEWLFQLLSRDYSIAKNPGSYNSQVGVPLSVWRIHPHDQLGIFEAGISQPGEMERLERIIHPTIGIFTNIGPAHDDGFGSPEHKAVEKCLLFRRCERVIYCRDHTIVNDTLSQATIPGYSWSFHREADVRVTSVGTEHRFETSDAEFTLTLPFTDKASVENSIHCITLMVYLKYHPSVIADRVRSLRSVPMRMELKEGINQCQIIDDSYNNDLMGLRISLDFLLNQKQKKKKRIILSDIQQSGLSDLQLSKQIAELISQSGIDSFVAIGPAMGRNRDLFPASTAFYPDTRSYLAQFQAATYRDEVILIKGARTFQFEKIANRLQRRLHDTVMEIDLGALVHNLNYFRARIPDQTKIMVMVKAFGYGSGSIELANVLQYHHVDYLGVAYADEGAELRRNNIELPVMVMNPTEESFDLLIRHKLEPEIYSFHILQALIAYLNNQSCVVHLKLDTGMHRLGFEAEGLDRLTELLLANRNITVGSIFSHLAGADEARHDAFSGEQATQFEKMANTISSRIGYKPLYHLLNSPGILRLTSMHYDMVRLGIGLHGVDPTGEHHELKPVATLKTIISQIRHVRKGDTIGYGRSGFADRDMKIATLAIGYADGFSRAFSNGRGQVLINGRLAPVIGKVCMDMTMVDATGIEVNAGEEAVIFGKDLPIQCLADKINTIPYEILTNTSERVKRVFVAESI